MMHANLNLNYIQFNLGPSGTSSFQICINSLRWQHISTLKCIAPITFALHTNTHELKKTTHTQSRVNLQGAGYLFHRTRLSSSVKLPFIHIIHNKSHQPSKHSWHTRHLFECVCKGKKKSVIGLNLLAPPLQKCLSNPIGFQYMPHMCRVAPVTHSQLAGTQIFGLVALRGETLESAERLLAAADAAGSRSIPYL